MVGAGPCSTLGRVTKYGTFVPSFDVASNCSVTIPDASKRGGNDLIAPGAALPLSK